MVDYFAGSDFAGTYTGHGAYTGSISVSGAITGNTLDLGDWTGTFTDSDGYLFVDQDTYLACVNPQNQTALIFSGHSLDGLFDFSQSPAMANVDLSNNALTDAGVHSILTTLNPNIAGTLNISGGTNAAATSDDLGLLSSWTISHN